MFEQLTEWSGQLSGLLWGSPLTLIALLGTGLYLTIRMGLIQVRGFGHAVGLISGKYSCRSDSGEVSHFQALSTALSATIGTGNIAGVATAITLGGPGALFWMWVTAFFGMATKFAECTLSLKFREISPDGEVAGGPMYTLLHGLKMKRTATLFAAFALVASFGIGNMVQANSVMDGLGYVFPELGEYKWLGGVILATMVGMVILGGVKRIARVASMIVP
ncbi:MAG: sodium:alanine symporter family protein, partial [Gammaproteobacteria bacterium]